MLSKRCFKCGHEKPLHEFYHHSAMADGHLNKCKARTRAYVAANRNANIERVRFYDRQRGNRQPATYLAQYRARFPSKYRAMSAVGNAVRDGRLKPEPCFICGRKAEAHHPDYDCPLDVV